MTDPVTQEPLRPAIGYVKGLPPSSPASQPAYLQAELGKIERASRDTIADLTARVQAAEDKLKALIEAEAKAREEGDATSAKKATELTKSLALELGEVKAAITREESVRVTNTEATARIIENLRAAISDGRVQSRGEINDERLVRANAMEALARRVESMSASFASASGQMNARIQTEEEVRASAVEAVATRTQTLEAQVITGGAGTLKSKIETVETAVSNLESSSASRLTTLESQVITGGPGTLKSRIETQETTFSNYQETQAGINQTLSSQATGEIGPLAVTKTITATINTNLQTWASLVTGTAGAEFTQALTSKFGNVEGSITSLSSTVSGPSGIAQKYGVTLDANGHVSGFQILNGSAPGSSSFTIAADKFQIRFPGSTKTPFSFENLMVNGAWTPTLTIDGVIKANQIQDNAVGTNQIAPGSVTNAVGSGGTSTPTLYTVGGPVLIIATCKAPIQIVGDTPVETTVYLQRNGGAIQSRTGIGQLSFLYIDYPGAGGQTYSMFTSSVSGISETAIAAIELRR